TLAQLGRAERAVRLIVSQRDEALAAQNRAEALGSAMLREHHALREACFDLAKRWESLPGEGPCGHAEQLRRVVRLHGWDAPLRPADTRARSRPADPITTTAFRTTSSPSRMGGEGDDLPGRSRMGEGACRRRRPCRSAPTAWPPALTRSRRPPTGGLPPVRRPPPPHTPLFPARFPHSRSHARS